MRIWIGDSVFLMSISVSTKSNNGFKQQTRNESDVEKIDNIIVTTKVKPIHNRTIQTLNGPVVNRTCASLHSNRRVTLTMFKIKLIMLTNQPVIWVHLVNWSDLVIINNNLLLILIITILIELFILDTNWYIVYPILHRTLYPGYKLIYSVSYIT